MITKLDDLVAAAKEKGRKRLIVAYGQDSHSLAAVSGAIRAGLVEATVFGDPAQIEKVCSQEGIDFNSFTTVAERVDTKCVSRAIAMIKQGEGDILMKGLVSSDKYMRGILNKENGLLPPKAVLSHVTVIQVPAYHKLLVVGDVAVIPMPDFAQKKAIASYLITTARSLGIQRPKVACIAPSEQLLPAVPSSVEAALLATMGRRGQLGANVDVDGPLAFDVSIDAESAATKGIPGPVAGDADCLLFPNLDTGNLFFKCCTKFAGAELAAMVTGTTAPCVLTSRGDSPQSKIYSIALASLSVK